MKIGIITLPPLNTNYGGILQAWALQQYLLNLGHDVVTFDFKSVEPLSLKYQLLHYPYRAYKKYFRGEKSLCIDFENRFSRNASELINFVNQNIKRRIFRNIDEINPNSYDCLIFGSDQVWRPLYWNAKFRNIADAFGAFVPQDSTTKLISYAASFGTDDVDEFPKDSFDIISKSLKRFSAISVREESGIEICKAYFDVEATRQIDPAMLHSSKTYLNLCSTIPFKKDLVATYILDDSDTGSILTHKLNQIFGYSPLKLCRNVFKEKLVNMEEWLGTFRDAQFVLTDSFHGSVFSIIFGTPFAVIDNPSRGTARIRSLLKLFDLEHHLITNSTELDSINRFNHSEKTMALLELFRKSSSEWIKDALSKMD